MTFKVYEGWTGSINSGCMEGKETGVYYKYGVKGNFQKVVCIVIIWLIKKRFCLTVYSQTLQLFWNIKNKREILA